ncbi:hypothetical protein ABHP78_003075 [Vibrio cholerae]
MEQTEKIYKCKSCKETVQKDAKKCPHCGEKYPTVSNAKGCLGFIVLSLIFGIIMASCSDKTPSNSSVQNPQSTQNISSEAQWYQGTSIQDKTLSNWNSATYEVKLVTAANVYAYFYGEQKLSPTITSKLKTMDDLKPYAQWLVKSVDEVASSKEGNLISNQKISETMVMLLTLEGHIK